MTSPASNEEFTQLLLRVRNGDESAIAQLVKQYEPEVRRAARRLLGPMLQPLLDSVDIAQSVHLSLVAGLQEQKYDLGSPENLIALAMTMVRRKVARQWRRLQGLRQREQSLDDRGATESNFAINDQLAQKSTPDPQDIVQHCEEKQRLLNLLDPTDRRLIELRLEGHSTAEAARRLALDPDVMRVRLMRLRKRLRDSNLLDDQI